MFALSTTEVLAAVDNPRDINDRSLPAAVVARVYWAAFMPQLRRARSALLLLEGWNLLIILISLIGFNYVPALSRASWFFCALMVVALVTALVPFWCVIVWTKGVEK